MNTPINSHTVKRYLPWVVACSLFMEQLDSTIVNTAVPAMRLIPKLRTILPYLNPHFHASAIPT